MSKMMTPIEFLSSYVEAFNAKDVSSLIDMYETGACFVVQPGQVVNGLENIRQSLQGFVDMNGKLESKVKGVIQTSNLALVNTEWFSAVMDLMENQLTLLVKPQMFYVNSQTAPGASS